ncbi:Programmed cell death protein 7, partial [Nibea albiflora]
YRSLQSSTESTTLTCAINSTRSWTDTPKLITLFRDKATKTGKIAEELAKLMRIYDLQSADGPDLTDTPVALLTVVTDDTTDAALLSPESICIVVEDEILQQQRRQRKRKLIVVYDMADTYHHPPSDNQQPPVSNSGYLETPYSANGHPPSAAHGPTLPDPTAQRWTPSQEYDGGHPYGFRCDFPAPSSAGVAFGGPCLAYSYGYDLSVPCPQSRHFPNMVPTAPGNTHGSKGASAFQTFPQKYELDSILKQQQHGYEGFFESGAPFGCPLFPPQDKDRTRAEHEAVQGKQDQKWLRRFLQSSDKTSRIPQTAQQQQCCVPELRQGLYTAALLVSQLAKSCETLRNNVENDSVWIDSYLMALNVKRQLQDKLTVFNDSWCLDSWKGKLSCVVRKRSQRLRARKSLQMEEKENKECTSAREAVIDTWRMKQIRQVEEKKKEQELKLAADTVLAEVRKKQADVKRMQDVMRSLEKLRRLRKEAASRKGIITEQECEESFNSQLQQLRCVLIRRTAVYSAEEKALMVMLEGEQEKEKRRENEKQVKKERERLLHRKHTVDIMLFGDEPSVDSVLQPFREYYTQAEHSLHTLLQIRREWDVFVVASDHPDGTPVPESWILPEPPSGPAWASALHTADTKSDTAQLTPASHGTKADVANEENVSGELCSMDDVPLRMPQGASQEAKEDVKVFVPDYLTILQETEYEFSLEKWVITGLQSGFTNQQLPQHSSTSGVLPSCPPYWMMFSSPQQSRLASRHCSDFWEPNPRQRSHSLNPAVLLSKFVISDSEDEGESATEKATTRLSVKACSGGECAAALCQRGQRTPQGAFVPDLLNPSACLSSLLHQCRKNLRQCSLTVLDTPKQHDPNKDIQSKSPSSNRAIETRTLNTKAKTVEKLPSMNNHNTTHMNSIRPDSCRNTTSYPGLPSSGLETSAELLSALSPEERELLRAITAEGYTLHTAINALQKMGQQTPEQILSYLLACDHLCQLGYDKAQVEEALEMFQNCETKAKEFLHLLSQFIEMGFQQNAIKEVLLIHENHRERALEELMMRVA